MKTALLLIDIQNDFLPGGALAVPDGDQVIPIANRLLPDFELVFATQDWHPPDHGSFAAQHPGHHVGDRVILDGLEQTLWPTHCVQGSHGAEFTAELQLPATATVVTKGSNPHVDSYSGFYDNGRRQATGLAEQLHEAGVEHLSIMGLATDYCVKFTALDARRLGFKVTLIVDGCRGVNLQPGDVERALEEMYAAGIKLASVPIPKRDASGK